MSACWVLAAVLLAAAGCDGWQPFPSYQKPTPTQSTFRVAVYDQAPSPGPPVPADLPRDEALARLRPILDDYSVQAAKAKEQGADMIVFAEYGLLPRGTSRDTVLPFLESVPSPHDAWTPCLEPNRHLNTETQRALSCTARNHSLYVIANLGDVVHCGATCPPSGRLQYNTNVVYNPNGTLVARYHKQNLFFESRFDTPTTTDFSFFDTPFGRFGTFVCFDVLFKNPPIPLIEEYQIDHVAFPTAWMNVLPYFSAVPFHQSFATGHGVNFLAANLHDPANRFSGSGVYSPGGPVEYRSADREQGSALLVADLQAQPPKVPRQQVHFTPGEQQHNRQPDFRSEVFGDQYNFVTLTNDTDTVMVCSDVTCCHLSYERNTTVGPTPKEHFALGAFRGLHTKEGTYFIEVCTLMKCSGRPGESCGEAGKTSATHFARFQLMGNFTSPYVYPQVTTEGAEPAAGQWEYDGRSIASNSTQHPLLAAIFFARRYDLDGTTPPNNTAAVNRLSIFSVLLLLFLQVIKLTI